MAQLNFKNIKRQFSHTRFLFLLIIVLNTLNTNIYIAEIQNTYRNSFKKDLTFCYNCFRHQIKHCSFLFEQIEDDEGLSLRQLLNFLPNLSCRRNHQLLRLKNSNEKIITKYLHVHYPQNVPHNFNKHFFKEEFLLRQEQLLGIQYAPVETVDHFIKYMQLFHTALPEIAVWHYLINNIQPLLYPLLFHRNFPVPKTYAVCGFSIYQQYGGQDLFNFFQADIFTKLEISKQLLTAAVQFSHGFDSYRLYITDLTADNIVYSVELKKIFFIDLDTIFIVDSSAAQYKSLIHKHNYVECNGCFGYSTADIAAYNISDVNVYLTCQFLREDLYRDQSKGFLYPIPSKLTTLYPKLLLLINKCVDCPHSECMERFTPAKELIAEIETILNTTVLFQIAEEL